MSDICSNDDIIRAFLRGAKLPYMLQNERLCANGENVQWLEFLAEPGSSWRIIAHINSVHFAAPVGSLAFFPRAVGMYTLDMLEIYNKILSILGIDSRVRAEATDYAFDTAHRRLSRTEQYFLDGRELLRDTIHVVCGPLSLAAWRAANA